MVEDGSTVDILYLNAYKRMGLAKSDLNPTTSPFYGFTRDYVVPKGTAKLTVTVGEHPRTSIVVVDFLIVDCLSAINGIIGIPLLKALKAITSIYHLTVKFPTTKGTGEVLGNQYDLRECYNKSLQMAEEDGRLLRMDAGKVATSSSKGPK